MGTLKGVTRTITDIHVQPAEAQVDPNGVPGPRLGMGDTVMGLIYGAIDSSHM